MPLPPSAPGQRCPSVLPRGRHAKWLACAAGASLLVLLGVVARPKTPPPSPHVFVPLSTDVSAPECGWRSSAPAQGSPPGDAAALAAAVLHADADSWAALAPGAAAGADAAACASGGCHVVVRSAALYFSSGVLAFAAGAAADAAAADQARLRADTRARAARVRCCEADDDAHAQTQRQRQRRRPCAARRLCGLSCPLVAAPARLSSRRCPRLPAAAGRCASRRTGGTSGPAPRPAQPRRRRAP
jgi:hypothetical protein